MTIDQFGIYPDIPDWLYHADPFEGGSLSSTGAKMILESPARYRWTRDNPEHKETFEFGHAAHAHVLGVGPEIEVLDFDDWRTKDARAARAECRLNGSTPILAHDWEVVRAMAEALRAHPLAAALLDGTGGRAEQSMFWPSSVGVALRTRVDWLPQRDERRRLIIPDYKTAVDADPRWFGRVAARLGYHQQAAWIIDGISTLWGVDDPAVVFIVQEKTPPYLVSVCELDAEALSMGHARNQRAIDIYAECVESGVWPGYPNEVHPVSLPKWAAIDHDKEYGDAGF